MKKLLYKKPGDMFKYSGSTNTFDTYIEVYSYVRDSDLYTSDYIYIEPVGERFRALAYKLDIDYFLEYLVEKVKILNNCMKRNQKESSTEELDSLVELVSKI